MITAFASSCMTSLVKRKHYLVWQKPKTDDNFYDYIYKYGWCFYDFFNSSSFYTGDIWCLKNAGDPNSRVETTDL